jgi:hypothetical protein
VDRSEVTGTVQIMSGIINRKPEASLYAHAN